MKFIIVTSDTKIVKTSQKAIKNISFHFPVPPTTSTYSSINSELETDLKTREFQKIYLISECLKTRSSGVLLASKIRQSDLTSPIIIFSTSTDKINKHSTIPAVYRVINSNSDYYNLLIHDLTKIININYDYKRFTFSSIHEQLNIPLKSIIYISRDKEERKLLIHTDNNIYKVPMTFKEITRYLDKRFLKTHRACLINTERIESINWQKRSIIFNTGEEILYLSKTYKDELDKVI